MLENFSKKSHKYYGNWPFVKLAKTLGKISSWHQVEKYPRSWSFGAHKYSIFNGFAPVGRLTRW